MIKAIKHISKKTMDRWQNITLLFFIVGLFILSYIAGNLKLVNFHTAIVLTALIFLPNLLVCIMMYIQADAERRSQYRIQLYLIAVFYTVVLFWRLSH